MATPIFDTPETNPFNLSNVGGNAAPTFVDIDDDGDLDAFVGTSNGNINYFENTGNASNPSFDTPETNPFNLSIMGADAAPTFVDIDNDGDLDAFVGDGTININYFENTGSASNPSFSASQTNPFNLNSGSGLNVVHSFVDIDDDGDLDAFVGNSKGEILYFENTGNAMSPSFGTSQTNHFGLSKDGNYAAPAFVDIDNDGDFDAFVGNQAGNIKL